MTAVEELNTFSLHYTKQLLVESALVHFQFVSAPSFVAKLLFYSSSSRGLFKVRIIIIGATTATSTSTLMATATTTIGHQNQQNRTERSRAEQSKTVSRIFFHILWCRLERSRMVYYSYQNGGITIFVCLFSHNTNWAAWAN